MNKFTNKQFAGIYMALINVYPFFKAEEVEQIKTWYKMLNDIDYGLLVNVVKEWINTETKAPTIADIRNRCTEVVLKLPSGIEAWGFVTEMANNPSIKGLEKLQKQVQEALKNIGGTWVINHSTQPSILRAQFIKTYNELKQLKIKAVNLRGELERIETEENKRLGEG